MEPITYHVRRSRLYSVTTHMLIASILLVAAPVGLFVLFYLTGDEVDLGLFAVFALVLVVVIPSAVRVLRHSSQAENSLRLNDDGLTHARRGKETFWSWRKFSPFRISQDGLFQRGQMGNSTIIPAEVPDDTRLSRLRRWTNRILFRRPTLFIRDIYLGRPDDIVADLNAYRSRALGGGNQPN